MLRSPLRRFEALSIGSLTMYFEPLIIPPLPFPGDYTNYQQRSYNAFFRGCTNTSRAHSRTWLPIGYETARPRSSVRLGFLEVVLCEEAHGGRHHDKAQRELE